MGETATSGFFGGFISSAVYATVRFWLPIILAYIFWKLWVYYLHEKWIKNISWVTLEIKIPREIMKSPKAMEVVLNGMYVTKDGNFKEKYWLGWLRVWFSLEIASIGGHIHFFVRVPKLLKGLVSAQFYAQYPDIEISEAEDYTEELVTGGRLNPDYEADGMEFILTKEDVYPIKTYIDHGLHETGAEEEQKTDPITSILEFMGSIGPGEQLWFQVLIRATLNKKWTEEAKVVVDKLMKRDTGKTEVLSFASLLLSPGERLVVEAIERGVSKLGFDVGIRFVYLGHKDKFNPVNIASMAGVMKQFSAMNLNGFRGINRAATDYFSTLREPRIKRRLVDAYVKRSYFHPPHERKWYVLNTEELATVYHFPGAVSETPTLGRVEAKKSEPPANLPI